jgi:hypothetical protein
MRRLLAAAALSTLLIAVGSASAAAADLRSELQAPVGDGWQETPAGGAADGPMTAADAATEVEPTTYGRNILGTGAFEQGYQRTWTQVATKRTLTEHVYLFGNPFGAGLWLGTVKGSDRDRPDWEGSFDTSAITNSFGGYRQLPDGSVETIVQFVPGDRVYGVTVRGQQEEQATAMDVATRLDDGAPQEVFTPAGAGGAAKVGLIVVGVLLGIALLVVGVVIVAIRSSRRQPLHVPQPAGVMYSPDGRWWWDGAGWQPVSGPPPKPPASPAP